MYDLFNMLNVIDLLQRRKELNFNKNWRVCTQQAIKMHGINIACLDKSLQRIVT